MKINLYTLRNEALQDENINFIPNSKALRLFNKISLENIRQLKIEQKALSI
jgi:hypothetical protein